MPLHRHDLSHLGIRFERRQRFGGHLRRHRVQHRIAVYAGCAQSRQARLNRLLLENGGVADFAERRLPRLHHRRIQPPARFPQLLRRSVTLPGQLEPVALQNSRAQRRRALHALDDFRLRLVAQHYQHLQFRSRLR